MACEETRKGRNRPSLLSGSGVSLAGPAPLRCVGSKAGETDVSGRLAVQKGASAVGAGMPAGIAGVSSTAAAAFKGANCAFSLSHLT